MAAAKKVGTDDEVSIAFHWFSDKEHAEEPTTAGIIPSSTPSTNQYSTPALVPNSSAAWATAAYLYLQLIFFDGVWFPGGYGNAHLLCWLLDWIRARCRDATEANARNENGENWLWRVVIGAYALTVVATSPVNEDVNGSIDINSESQRTVADLVDWYTEQLRKRQQATWVLEWVDAKGVLEKIHWLQIPGSHGELVLETALKDSLRACNDR